MDIQNILACLIVAIAAVFALRGVIRQFYTEDGACKGCDHCQTDKTVRNAPR